MSSLNDIKVNTSWDLRQCCINNNNANFYVKLIHVDQYAKQMKEKKMNQKLIIKKQSESRLLNNQAKQRERNLIVPSSIVDGIPLPNNRPKTKSIKTDPSKQFRLTIKPKSQLKYRNTQHRIHAHQTCYRSETPIKQRRSYTESLNDYRKKTEKQQKPSNQTFYFQQKFTNKILKTEPNEHDRSNQKNTSFLSKSSKKPTIRQLLFYQPERVLKSKQTAMKNFRKSLKRARFSYYNFEEQL